MVDARSANGLRATVQRTLTEELALKDGARVLVAISGGADSTALLHVLASLQAAHRFTVVAHGVDHGLRAEAAAELDGAASLARALDVPFTRTQLRVRSGSNLQARAREARHAALRRAAAACDATDIATGHHADDRAETLLLRLLRGTSPAGLAVLPPRRGLLVRPLIRVRRAQVLAYLAHHELRWAEDPSNEQDRFLRVRVRRELLPLFTELAPRIVDHLTLLADEADPTTPALVVERDGTPFVVPRAGQRELVRMVRQRLRGAVLQLPHEEAIRFDGERLQRVAHAGRARGGQRPAAAQASSQPKTAANAQPDELPPPSPAPTGPKAGAPTSVSPGEPHLHPASSES